MVKTILYKKTIALGTSINFSRDLRRSEPRGDSGGSGWRKEAVETGVRIHNITEKTPREIFSTCSQRVQICMKQLALLWLCVIGLLMALACVVYATVE